MKANEFLPYAFCVLYLFMVGRRSLRSLVVPHEKVNNENQI